MTRCASRVILLLKEGSFHLPGQFDGIELVIFTGFMNNGVPMRIGSGDIDSRLKEIGEDILRAMFSSIMNRQFSLVISDGEVNVSILNEISQRIRMIVHCTVMRSSVTKVILSIDVTI